MGLPLSINGIVIPGERLGYVIIYIYGIKVVYTANYICISAENNLARQSVSQTVHY